ncbi:MAG TPA: hypothetical protein VGQ51_05090 [Puia sp.]|jgi:hypothetical protein|nr:hypothetical protein [Puia sp.]
MYPPAIQEDYSIGSVLLMPVMVNIFLIDIFYHIPTGALLNCSLFMLGLIFLLYLRRKELIALFLGAGTQLPDVGKGWMRWSLRLLVIGGAIAIECVVGNNTHSVLEGKWHVDTLRRNGHVFEPDEWLRNSGCWTTAYMEQGGWIVLCPNPYIYDVERSYAGRYEYDAVARRLRGLFDNGKDTLVATVGHYDGSHMEWQGMLGKDTLYMRLSRAK